jgi:hypothetical protein
MKLTRIQRRSLKAWRRYHTAGYGVREFTRTHWSTWLALAAGCVLTFFLVFPCFPVCLGVILGIVYRDVTYFQASRLVWPVTEQIVDWSRVNELIENSN